MSVAGVVAAMVVASMVTAACSRQGYRAEPDERFDRVWTVESLTVDDSPYDLGAGLVVVDIDTRQASVQIETGCRTLLGSFSLLDDGRAGFSLPGSDRDGCGDDIEPWLAELDATLGATLEAVDRWDRRDGRLVLSNDRAEVVLRHT